MAKIYSGETFGEYCERLNNLHRAGHTLFQDLKEGEYFFLKSEKPLNVYVKLGGLRGLTASIFDGHVFQCAGEFIVEKITLDKAAQPA